MREIIFDTETTGLDFRLDRVIEIGAIEMMNRFPTGRTFHHYIHPEDRQIHPDAQAVHGISLADLQGKPVFSTIAADFADFIADAKLIAHNANFDISFINAEFGRIGHPVIEQEWVIDSLALARRKHPLGPNSLDALCKRYGIDNSRRTKHGALLDSELLAEVYIELIGGKQTSLVLDSSGPRDIEVSVTEIVETAIKSRPFALPNRLTAAEIVSHQALVSQLGEKSTWNAPVEMTGAP